MSLAAPVARASIGCTRNCTSSMITTAFLRTPVPSLPMDLRSFQKVSKLCRVWPRLRATTSAPPTPTFLKPSSSRSRMMAAAAAMLFDGFCA